MTGEEHAQPSAVQRFDDAVDVALDRLRGHPAADRAFYAASELADFSLLWYLLGAGRSLRSDDPLRDLTRIAVIIGAESLIVNGGLKSLFQRERPVHDGEHPHALRQPLTTSFPSGHASAAFVAATLFAEDARLPAAWYLLAAGVATSRAYVRIHHASDVVGGAAIGLALGRVALRIWPRR